MENQTKQILAGELEKISVLNAYTKRCYGQFTTEQKAKDYMDQMLLKEVGFAQYSEPDHDPYEDMGGSHCIWVFDARGVEGV